MFPSHDRGDLNLINSGSSITFNQDNRYGLSRILSDSTAFQGADIPQILTNTSGLGGIPGDISIVSGNINTINSTVNEISGNLTVVSGDVDAILVDTADMQPKLGTISNLGGGTTIGDNLNDIAGGGFTSGNDSLSAIRDRGDAAWITSTLSTGDINTALTTEHGSGDWTTGAGGSGDATAANQTTIISHLTGIKGIGFVTTDDSLEAIRNRGDVAWTGDAGLGDDILVISGNLNTTNSTLSGIQGDLTVISGNIDTVDNNVDSILVDTSTDGVKLNAT